jgi:DNA-binding transcriptional ArsR family regulator
MVESSDAPLDLVFHALADGTRREILRLVSRKGMPVGEVAKPFNISLAAVSKHLDVLERANLIRRERRGSHRLVYLNPAQLKAAQDWLSYYETFWSTALDRLQQHFENQQN